VHPECNDPVFRCFALSKSAFKIANKFPEYRSEYEAVALAANKLSAELLDQVNVSPTFHCHNDDFFKMPLERSAKTPRRLAPSSRILSARPGIWGRLTFSNTQG